MSGAGHALVIGKFYPPHRGHHALIRGAARTAGAVTVVAMASGAESVPLADRVGWLRSAHPDVAVAGVVCDAPVDVTDATVWAAQVAAIEAAVRAGGVGRPVDTVVSGEAYGDELAARLGAVHRHLDRRTDVVSGTAVRADLAGHWDDLEPATRAGLAARVVVVGAESTGTTTLAERLAVHFRARGGSWSRTGWVEEYGREHTSALWKAQAVPALADVVWTAADFAVVAEEQTRREQAAAATGSPILICDTDALATAVWQRRYLGEDVDRRPAWAAGLPRRDLYLVTDHRGVPWQDDGMREGELAVRAAMTGWFMDALTAAGQSWVLLTGTFAERWSLALRSIGPVLDRRLTFAEPLHGPGFEPTRG